MNEPDPQKLALLSRLTDMYLITVKLQTEIEWLMQGLSETLEEEENESL